MIFLNAFFPGALLVLCISIYFAYFIWRMKDKSPATLHLGATMLFMTLFNFVYAVRYAVSAEWVAFLRWGSVGLILPTMIHWTQYLLHSPTKSYPKLGRRLLLIQWIGNILVTIWFIGSSMSSGIVTNFQGHYYDLDADALSGVHSLFLISYLSFSLVVAIWKSLQVSGQDRASLILQGITIFVVLIIPAILNMMSRDGLLTHEIYQNSYSVTMSLGLFTVVTAFLNTTKDQTPLMSRIVGISLVTFLLIMQFISSVGLGDKQKAFASHLELLGRLRTAGINPREKDIPIITHSLPLKFSAIERPDVAHDTDRLYISAWRQGVALGILRPFLTTDFAKDLVGMIAERCDGKGLLAIEKCFKDLDPQISFAINSLRRSGIATLTKDEWLTKFQSISHRIPALLSPLRNFVTSANIGKIHRDDIIAVIPVTQAAGVPRFHVSGDQRYVSYVWLDREYSRISEVSAPYSVYQVMIHETSFVLASVILVGFMVLTLIFPVFFSVFLMRPLNRLLTGVRKVQAGDLGEKVHIAGSDEISELGRAFNAMTEAVRDSKGRLREYASELESKVQERTRHLRESLNEIQNLKQQQDGDYFLTSLLLNPLGRNQVKAPGYSVEFLIQQKKRFDFKTWKSEIGGDLCISDQLDISGKRYIVLLNADAMGKSMQGAGGAVVMGSIFHAILERNRKIGEKYVNHPEGWIRDTFAELQKVFVVFDGSMLVSLFLALIDEESGAMYFVNAEHPWPVLLRSGKPYFVKHKVFLRKLGVVPPEVNFPWSHLREDTPIQIDVLQLLHGDKLVIGSDGRDDLMMGQAGDESGKSINEDETAFLRVVGDSDGDLRVMVDSLRNVGEIVDDLSLIRLGVSNDVRPEPESAPAMREDIMKLAEIGRFQDALVRIENLETHREKAAYRAYVYFQSGAFEQAENEAKTAFDQRPSKSDILYLLSRIHRKRKEFSQALHYGERYRLRNPRNLHNLANMASLCLAHGDIDQAECLALQVIHYDETNSTARKILASIELRRANTARSGKRSDVQSAPVSLREIL